MNPLSRYLIRRAERTPYTHLLHTDGSPYMMRYWLVPYGFDNPVSPWRRPLAWLLQRFDIAIRVHHICTADLDRALHDHPWSFLSVVLHGFYIEKRPIKISPCFFEHYSDDFHGTYERGAFTFRKCGSVAFRHATDRHRITDVCSGGVWTLFITGPQRQWWGFYTPKGKIYYRDYIDNKEAIK